MEFNKTACACASSEKSEILEHTTPGGTPLICSLLPGFPALLPAFQRGGVLSHSGQEQGEASIAPLPRRSALASHTPLLHPYSPIPQTSLGIRRIC